MLYLAISLPFAAWWALSYKIAVNRHCSGHAVITVACATAAGLVLLWELLTHSLQFNGEAAFIGVIAGLLLFTATMSYFELIRRGVRLGLSWTIMTLSMVLPTCLSIFLWKEIPSVVQALGLLSAIASVCLLGDVKVGGCRLPWRAWALFVTAFVASGMVAVCSKLIPVRGLEDFKLTYLLHLYAVIFVLAFARSCLRKDFPRLAGTWLGLGMGVASVGNVFFTLLALERLTGTVAFPLKTCGELLLMLLLGYLIWRERIDRKESVGVGFACLAIVLMNAA